MKTNSPKRSAVSGWPAIAVAWVARSLVWLFVLGLIACTKEASNAPHSKGMSARVAPATSQPVAASNSAEPKPVANSGAPTSITDATPSVPDQADDEPRPVHRFVPFTQHFGGQADDPFKGQTFHLRFHPGDAWLEVSSCATLLALPLAERPTFYLEPSTEDELKALWYMAVDCLALRLVRTAKPAQRSHMAELLSSKDPGRLLPPQLGMVDFDDERKGVEAAAARCQSWMDYDRDVRVTQKSPGRFAIRAEDWSGDLVFYVRGDIDGDGDEDVLVRRDGGVQGGSYGGTALFVLSQTEHDPCVRVVREFGSS